MEPPRKKLIYSGLGVVGRYELNEILLRRIREGATDMEICEDYVISSMTLYRLRKNRTNLISRKWYLRHCKMERLLRSGFSLSEVSSRLGIRYSSIHDYVRRRMPHLLNKPTDSND